MPEQSLKLLLEYNQERLEEDCTCGGAGDPQYLSREAAFVDLAETLAAHTQFTPHLLPMLANPELGMTQKQMVFYLLWLSDEELLQKQALETYFGQEEAPVDLLPALALLDTSRQQQAITQLAGLNSKAACQTLAGHFLVNPGQEAYRHLFVDAQGHARYEGGVFDQLAAHSGIPQLRRGLTTRFKAAQGDEKGLLATALLSAQCGEALDWLCKDEGLVHDRCLHFALLSGPKAYERLVALTRLPVPETILLEIASNLKWYGNPWGTAFLHWGTTHENAKIQHTFHGLLMAFFDQDDPVMFEGWLLLEEDVATQAGYKEKLSVFWTGKENYLKNYLRKKRYFQSTPFDIKRLFEDYTGKRNHYELGEHTSLKQFVDYLSLWTGQALYYDDNALLSKQCQQIKHIGDWLDANPFEQGRWLCFGEYTQQ